MLLTCYSSRGEVLRLLETNWAGQVMSIGTIATDADDFEVIEAKYHILPTECKIGVMYYSILFIETPISFILCTCAVAITRSACLISAYRYPIHLRLYCPL